MLPDSDEVNLSPAELQILSELDSRQFGFLRLNSLEHRKKKAVVVKAIKYLERMLIQAYCQQEREKRCTVTANTAENNSEQNESSVEKMDTTESETTDQADGTKTPKAEPNASPTPNDVEMTDASEPVVTIKQEPEDEVTSVEVDPLAEDTTADGSSKNDEKEVSQPEIQDVKTESEDNESESNKENNKESSTESNDEPIKIEESTSDKDDPYSKDINIDPRTYCKLGHFHLLLEDYSKAMSAYQKFFGTLERHSIFVWSWYGVLSLQRVSMMETNASNRYEWSQELQGLIISSLFWGTVLSQIPGGVLVQKCGAKIVLLTTTILSAIVLATTPLAVFYGGAIGLLTTRVLIGILQGPVLPAIASLSIAWFPIEERGRANSITMMGINTCGFLSTYLIGFVINQTNGRWDVVFYGLASVTAIGGISFGLLCYDTPETHPFIGLSEKTFLKSKTDQYLKTEKKLLPPTPWKAILTNIPVIALVVSSTLYHFAINVLNMASSKYLNDVIHASIQNNSLYNSLPRIVNMVSKIVFGIVSDWMHNKRNLSLTAVRKIFTTISSMLQAFSIIAAAYSGCDEMLVAIFLNSATLGHGFDTAGVDLNAYDLGPNYIGPLQAFVFTVATLGTILAPYVVGVMTPHAYIPEWRNVFWLTFATYISNAAIFLIWGSAEVQSWNTPNKSIERK